MTPTEMLWCPQARHWCCCCPAEQR